MPRTYTRTKKRGRASVARRVHHIREKTIQKCLSDEYVAEDSHVPYYASMPDEKLPDLEIELTNGHELFNNTKVLQGKRIVDISYFIEEIKKLAVHDLQCTMGKMKFIKETRRGLVSKIQFYCESCNKTRTINTHPDNSLSIGIGFAQLQEFLAVLDVPTIVGKKWQNELCQQMKRAAEEERQMARSDGNLENGIPYITVIVDGGWAKRSYGHGYSSMSEAALEFNLGPSWHVSMLNSKMQLKYLCKKRENFRLLKQKQRLEKRNNKTSKVASCGFFIYNDKPYLGASPDGLVGEDSIIEVKCLYSIRDSKIKDSAKNNKNLCIEYNADKDCIQIKKRHKYYYQVQGQLNITDRNHCYFGLFTNADCEIIEIKRDRSFWFSTMLPKLSDFWENCVLPELVDPRVPRGLRARDSPSIIQAQHAIKKNVKN
ncbi:hypothetical protein RN001_007813 [Aquatica leii]|uniref:YqaJ viral recombinase domain-containing protein n=1 Tax=Aquatica leii TaxID=1421715 RepID=A0AAN7PYI1_9COLE|nr:hypothetical protein RN001_007813 [Aquatica leii]